jgi:hypothetical protein
VGQVDLDGGSEDVVGRQQELVDIDSFGAPAPFFRRLGAACSMTIRRMASAAAAKKWPRESKAGAEDSG